MAVLLHNCLRFQGALVGPGDVELTQAGKPPPQPNQTRIMSDIDTKALELIQKHREFEKMKNEFEKMKLDYLCILKRQGIGAVDIKEGKINVCTRNTKDYGDTVKNMEASLKAEKTRLDYLGEFVIKATTHYLRIG